MHRPLHGLQAVLYFYNSWRDTKAFEMVRRLFVPSQYGGGGPCTSGIAASGCMGHAVGAAMLLCCAVLPPVVTGCRNLHALSC